MTRKPVEEREFQFVYICSLLSKTLFMRKKINSKLRSFLHRIFSTFFLNGEHIWLTLFIKRFFLFQIENKNCNWNCCLWQQIKLHPTSWQYPLINWWIYSFLEKRLKTIFNHSFYVPYARHYNPLLITNCSWIFTIH